MKKVVITDKAPKAIGTYSQAIEANDMLFISGQIPLDPETNSIVDGGILEQTFQVFKNISAILQTSGYTFEQVVKTTVFLTDLSNFEAMNKIYNMYFVNDYPARSTIGIKELPKNSLIEIELIAIK